MTRHIAMDYLKPLTNTSTYLFKPKLKTVTGQHLTWFY